MSIECRTCGNTFNDYKELAQHIMANRKTHKMGKKWAAKYILINGLSASKRGEKFNGRVALTQEQKDSRNDSKRTLSGDNDYVNAVCPKCSSKHRPLVPAEFAMSEDALKINGLHLIICSACS